MLHNVFKQVIRILGLPMRTIKDDFTGKEHSADRNISLQITFRSEKVFYKALVDISPETYMSLFGKVKVPFGKYIKHKTEEEKAEYNGKEGHYVPVGNGNSIIATMVEVAPNQ